MELQPVIEFLTRQKQALDETIACLERLRTASVPPAEAVAPVAAKRRGRKFMAPEDRRKVSERMKEYWEARRTQRAQAAGGGGY